MSFFEPISGADFGEKLEQARKTAGALIFDLRSEEDYELGHIPGAKSLPLNRVPLLDVPKDTPLFLYCHSGVRSTRGRKALEKMGFTAVTNLGGILDYQGPLEVL